MFRILTNFLNRLDRNLTWPKYRQWMSERSFVSKFKLQVAIYATYSFLVAIMLLSHMYGLYAGF